MQLGKRILTSGAAAGAVDALSAGRAGSTAAAAVLKVGKHGVVRSGGTMA